MRARVRWSMMCLVCLFLSGCASSRPAPPPPQRLTAQAEVFRADVWFGETPEHHVIQALEAMALDGMTVAGYLELAEHLTDAGADGAAVRVMRRLEQRIALAGGARTPRWQAWIEASRWRDRSVRFARGWLARGLCQQRAPDRCVTRAEGLLAAGFQEARRAWGAYDAIASSDETIGLQLLRAIEREQLDRAQQLSWLLTPGRDLDRYLGELATALHTRGRVRARDAVLARLWAEIGRTSPTQRADRWVRGLRLEQALRPDGPVLTTRVDELNTRLSDCTANPRSCLYARDELCEGLSKPPAAKIEALAKLCPPPDRASWTYVEVLRSVYAVAIRDAARRGEMTRAIRLTDELSQRGHRWRHLTDALLAGCARHDRGWDALELLFRQVDEDVPRAELLSALAEHAQRAGGHEARVKAIALTLDKMMRRADRGPADADAQARLKLAQLRLTRAKPARWLALLQDASDASARTQLAIALAARPDPQRPELSAPLRRALIDQLMAPVIVPAASPELSALATALFDHEGFGLTLIDQLWGRLPSSRARAFFARRVVAEAKRQQPALQRLALQHLLFGTPEEVRHEGTALLRHMLGQPDPAPRIALDAALDVIARQPDALSPSERTLLARALLLPSAEHPAEPLSAAKLARTINEPFYRQVAFQDIMEHMTLRERWSAPERKLVVELIDEAERSTARGGSREAYRAHAVALLIRDGQCARASRMTPRAQHWTTAQLTTCARHDPALATRQALRLPEPRARAHALLTIMRHTSRATLTRALAAGGPERP